MLQLSPAGGGSLLADCSVTATIQFLWLEELGRGVVVSWFRFAYGRRGAVRHHCAGFAPVAAETEGTGIREQNCSTARRMPAATWAWRSGEATKISSSRL